MDPVSFFFWSAVTGNISLKHLASWQHQEMEMLLLTR